MEEFHKVRRLPPYVFEQVNRLKASARAAGADIIDLGMGNPDLPTPQSIVDKLCEVVQDPRTHRYSSSKGIPGLRRAQAAYYARRFGVKLNPETQVVATLGSKEGFANMLFIASDGTIRTIHENAVPLSEAIIDSREPVAYVLELNAGSVKRLGISPGDRLEGAGLPSTEKAN